MAAEASDLAADLLAALGSTMSEEPMAVEPRSEKAASLPVSEAPRPSESAPPHTPSPAPIMAPTHVETPVAAGTKTNGREPGQETTMSAPIPTIEPPPASAAPPSPKRQRTPDEVQENDAKRLKVDHEGPNLDMALLLQDALGSFDEQIHPPGEADHMGLEEVELLSATATPAPAKPGPKLMNASDKPLFMMRSMSLPVLGNLAVQILLRLAQQPRTETKILLAEEECEFRKTYDTLKTIFGSARKMFSDSASLLSCDELDITDSEDRETIRMSNLATVSLSLFDSLDVPLKQVHDQFLSICVQELGEYREQLTDPFVALKTQAFLQARQTMQDGQDVNELLDHYFPADFEESLRQRSGEMFLNFSEDLLVAVVKERKEMLAKAIRPRNESGDTQTGDTANEEHSHEHGNLTLETIAEQHPAEELVNAFGAYLQSHLGAIVEYADKYGVNIPVAEEPVNDPICESTQDHIDTPMDVQDNIQDDLQASLEAELQASMDVDMKPDAQENTSTQMPAEHQPESQRETPADIPSDVHNGDFGGNDDLAALLRSATEKMGDETGTPQEGEQSLSDSLGLSSIIQEELNNDMDLASLIRENLGEATEARAVPAYNMPSYANINGEVNGQPQFQSLAQLNQLHAAPYHSYTQSVPQAAPLVNENGDLLPPNQSSPTAVLYERARQAAVAKSSSSTRREGLHSTRRPWTPEEEKALMAGLDMVKGPHWSQILSLFGVNGTVSDILKDRTQVQLKDKARNLKLFFLKTSSEMPYYLQSVTGELKTRAPSQAARKEAEEKARVNSEEEQARLQGIMTLANGLQNNHPNTRSPIPTTTPMQSSPITPRHATTGTGGTPGTQAPLNIAPAPTTSGAQIRSPDIKSEPADGSGVPHGYPQHGVPIQQQLAQMHSRVKQEVHGLPQIQPRIPTPHAPLASAAQVQAQVQVPMQNSAQGATMSRPLSRPPSLPQTYRPAQLPQIQPQPGPAPQRPHTPGQAAQPAGSQAATQQLAQALGQTSSQHASSAQQSTGSSLSLPQAPRSLLSLPQAPTSTLSLPQTPASTLSLPQTPTSSLSLPSPVQTPAQALAQAQSQAAKLAQSHQPSPQAAQAPSHETTALAAYHQTHAGSPATQQQPSPAPAPAAPASSPVAPQHEHTAAPSHVAQEQATASTYHSNDDSAEASLIETLRAAMASVPDNPPPMVSSEASTA